MDKIMLPSMSFRYQKESFLTITWLLNPFNRKSSGFLKPNNGTNSLSITAISSLARTSLFCSWTKNLVLSRHVVYCHLPHELSSIMVWLWVFITPHCSTSLPLGSPHFQTNLGSTLSTSIIVPLSSIPIQISSKLRLGSIFKYLAHKISKSCCCASYLN